MPPPSLVFHADWSSGEQGRRGARAVRADGRYYATVPAGVGAPSTLLRRLRDDAGGNGSVLAGFDFPIGVPAGWAAAAGVTSFRELLPRLGEGQWAEFFEVARKQDELSRRRPFYPAGSGEGEHSRLHLTERLGVEWPSLLRLCDREQPERREASAIFWTLGGAQVGKAAISGWRDLLVPALRDPQLDVAVWPFDGGVRDLVAPGRVVVAETYPAEFYGHLRIVLGGAKRSRDVRAGAASALRAAAAKLGLELQPELEREVDRGFEDDDAFDAFVGLLGMLNVVLGFRGDGAPEDDAVRTLEGWMLGQEGDGEATVGRHASHGEPRPERPATDSGYQIRSIDELGSGYGFRKVREALGVTAFGVNVIVMPPRTVGRPHYHERQDELYFVHRGRAVFRFVDGEREVAEGSLVHVEAATRRVVVNHGPEDLVLLVVGGKDGYVGRDGVLAPELGVDPD